MVFEMEKRKLSLPAQILSIIAILILTAFIIIYGPLVISFGAEDCIPLLIALIFAIIFDILLIINLINPLAPAIGRGIKKDAIILTKSVSLDPGKLDVTVKYCSHCGTTIHKETETCPGCGRIFVY
jgi:hypothetical protein